MLPGPFVDRTVDKEIWLLFGWALEELEIIGTFESRDAAWREYNAVFWWGEELKNCEIKGFVEDSCWFKVEIELIDNEGMFVFEVKVWAVNLDSLSDDIYRSWAEKVEKDDKGCVCVKYGLPDFIFVLKTLRLSMFEVYKLEVGTGTNKLELILLKGLELVCILELEATLLILFVGFELWAEATTLELGEYEMTMLEDLEQEFGQCLAIIDKLHENFNSERLQSKGSRGLYIDACPVGKTIWEWCNGVVTIIVEEVILGIDDDVWIREDGVADNVIVDWCVVGALADGFTGSEVDWLGEYDFIAIVE